MPQKDAVSLTLVAQVSASLRSASDMLFSAHPSALSSKFMYDVITIGGATFDIFMKSEKFRVVPGEQITVSDVPMLCLIHGTKLVIEGAYFEIGGGGTNVAVGLANLGLKVAFEGVVGKDLEGKRVLELFKKRKVNTSMVSSSNKQKTALSVILYRARERTILTYRGISDYLTKDLVDWNKIAKTKWLFVSHLSGKSHNLLKEIIKLKVKNPQIKIAWNPGSTQLDKGIKELSKFLACTDVLIVNKEEAERLTKIKIENPKGLKMKSFRPLFEKLTVYGPKIFVITNGRRGAQAYDQGKIHSYPALPVKIIANIGAGDAFCSGFIAAIILGESI